ncbi:MAG TPA: helix-turn-helix domain-containing protein, partial [bacterium]|nr:helix-turn-helix domain-containing protein [bacterium]
EENKTHLKMAPEVLTRLMGYHWPGNVRELENTVERMAVMAKGNLLTVEDVPLPLGLPGHVQPAAEVEGAVYSQSVSGATLTEMEKMKVMEAMERCGGVQAKACKLLGITPRQLGYKLKKYKIGYKPTFL